MLLLSSLSAGAASAQPDDRPPAFPSLDAQAPVGAGALQPCLQQLPGSVRCGRYRVWENRTAARGRTLDLAFVVADALDPASHDSDAVTFLLGGPGSSPVAQATVLITAFARFRAHRDFLLVDPRGVGDSGALDCDVPYPRGVASRFETLFPADQLRACVETLTPRAALDQYTSAAAMDDLDDLRRWLNYGALDFYAGSYGTKEAQVYARRHRDGVRTLLLDAPSPISEKSYLLHARFLDRALSRLVDECAAETACQTEYPRLGQELDALIARAAADPPVLSIDGTPVRFGSFALGYALRGLLYQRAAEIPRRVHRAAQGEWQELADYYLQRQGWVAEPGGFTGYHLSVVCSENIDFVTDDEVAQATAGSFLGDRLINAYRDACRIWPHARLDRRFLDPVHLDAPTLILSGERDPVTPPSNGEEIAAHASNSRHVVIPHGGHGSFDDCYQSMVETLFETGSIEKLDLSCAGESPPSHFEPAAGGT